MKNYLLLTGEYDEVVVLQNEQATFSNIRYFMQQYFPSKMQNGRYRFLFYFSGHGTQHKGYDNRVIGSLLLKGATGEIGDENAIDMGQLEIWSNRLRFTNHMLFLLDCCFSGLAGQEVKSYNTQVNPKKLAKESGRFMITSGGADEKSIADIKKWGGSLFTDVLIEGMKGEADSNVDGVVITYELFTYVQGAVKNQAEFVSHKQTPLINQLGSPYKDKGQYFFVYKYPDLRKNPPIAKSFETTKTTLDNKIPPKEYTNSLGMRFVLISPGEFYMGQSDDEKKKLLRANSYEHYKKHYKPETPRHKVSITKYFYMQSSETTIGQWRQFVSESKYKTEAERRGGALVLNKYGNKFELKHDASWKNPYFVQTEKHPVTCISWNDTQEFINWLNSKGEGIYRLPTEAEWEYACRAGTQTFYSYGDCLSTDQANYNGNFPPTGCKKGQYRGKTIAVSSLKPNSWGLYNMHGNVAEWCQDWYADYPSQPVTDPIGLIASDYRIMRGGSWFYHSVGCRSAGRYYDHPTFRHALIGFRLVRLLKP